MQASFNRLLSEALPFAHAHEQDELRGKVRSAKAASDGKTRLSNKLDERLGASRRFGFREQRGARAPFDARQRAVVKLHYFGHGGGGARALSAHARYIAREAASRDQRENALDADEAARAHGAYLERKGTEAERPFYDALDEGVEGAARMAAWAKTDRRHFRIILAPENGGDLGDLKPYVRDVMARAETALGTQLEWVAVDHWDTDNPHTHIVLRGRRADGRGLVIPRLFVQHGFRDAARDAATDRLGPRTRAQERDALDRETRAHRPTRLDAMIAGQISEDGALRLSRLRAPNGRPDLTNALKSRARELQRLGLASETKRNVLSFSRGWRDQLSAMELHLNIRKQLIQQRTAERDVSRGLLKGMIGR